MTEENDASDKDDRTERDDQRQLRLRVERHGESLRESEGRGQGEDSDLPGCRDGSEGRWNSSDLHRQEGFGRRGCREDFPAALTEHREGGSAATRTDASRKALLPKKEEGEGRSYQSCARETAKTDGVLIPHHAHPRPSRLVAGKKACGGGIQLCGGDRRSGERFAGGPGDRRRRDPGARLPSAGRERFQVADC